MGATTERYCVIYQTLAASPWFEVHRSGAQP
jgi:hypothetical protein